MFVAEGAQAKNVLKNAWFVYLFVFFIINFLMFNNLYRLLKVKFRYISAGFTFVLSDHRGRSDIWWRMEMSPDLFLNVILIYIF